MALTQNQRFSMMQQFFTNGVYIPTRTVVFGTNSFKEDSEITDADVVDFVKSLHVLEDISSEDSEDNTITVILNTCGGDMYLGLAMYDAIKACKSPVEIRAIGQCMSMGCLVLQAGDYRYSYPNTSFMMHKGTIDMGGEVSLKDAEITGAENDRVVKRILDIYENTLEIDRDELDEMLEIDTFMDANKAKRIGLIDGIKESF